MNKMLLIFDLALIAACLWTLFCNVRTFDQRQKMRESIEPRSKPYYPTTYYEHFWALFFFLDPMKLYERDGK